MDAQANAGSSYRLERRVPRAIESASASTRDQANDSTFSYTVTIAVLGVLALIGVALGLLLYSVAMQTARDSDMIRDISSIARPNVGKSGRTVDATAHTMMPQAMQGGILNIISRPA